MRRPARRLFTLVLAFAAGCACARERAEPPDPSPPTAALREAPPTAVDRISVFRTVRVLDDGLLLLAVSEREGGINLSLALNDVPRWGKRVEAAPGDVVHVTTDLLGAGLRWYDVVMVSSDGVILRENRWWRHDREPDPPRLLRVLPYGDDAR